MGLRSAREGAANLNQLDEFKTSKNIKIIMATNRLDILKPSALFKTTDKSTKDRVPSTNSQPLNRDPEDPLQEDESDSVGIDFEKDSREDERVPGAVLCAERAGMYALREGYTSPRKFANSGYFGKVMNRNQETAISEAKLFK